MSLSKFFEPKSIAVIGASHEPGKLGYIILENIKNSFKDVGEVQEKKIYPINPSVTEIQDLKTYPSVLDVEESIDTAIIAVPAKIVKSVIEDCLNKKIRNIVIISSGFSEIGKIKEEMEIKKLTKGKARVLGPNCLGVYTKNLDMLFLPRKKLKRPSEGVISFITQSGTIGIALIDLLSFEGMGFSKFVSYGNAIDINETDLIEYLGKDMNTRCIAAYIESIKEGKKFIEIAKKTTKIKPIVVLKAGKTKRGEEAVISHTGALAGSSQIYSAAFKQAGIIEAKTTDELFDFAKALANQPVLKTNNIAVITNGGGFGVLAADASIENGLFLSDLGKETEKKLKKCLPQYCSLKNPIDISGDADVERFEKTLDVVLKDENVSGLLCTIIFQTPKIEDLIVPILVERKVHGKPIVVCSPGGDYSHEKVMRLEKLGIPVYPTPERAVKALKALFDYGKIAGKK